MPSPSSRDLATQPARRVRVLVARRPRSCCWNPTHDIRELAGIAPAGAKSAPVVTSDPVCVLRLRCNHGFLQIRRLPVKKRLMLAVGDRLSGRHRLRQPGYRAARASAAPVITLDRAAGARHSLAGGGGLSAAAFAASGGLRGRSGYRRRDAAWRQLSGGEAEVARSP